MNEQSVKRKKPPSFPHVHPSRARKFKKAWVEKAKITSKWKTLKKKEGLIEKAKLDVGFDERDDPDEPYLSNQEPHPQVAKNTNSEGTSRIGIEQDDVRELTRKAYSKSNLHTFKSDPLKKRAASERSKGEKGKGQPDMKLRMDALLAKIKRDYA